MNKKVVTILSKSMSNPDYGRGWESTAVYVDGKLVGIGSYGGEPEDNSRGRDYGWVESLLSKLSVALGAEVTIKDMDYTTAQEQEYFEYKDVLYDII